MLPVTVQDGFELFIHDIAVHPVHQREGIGRRLIQAALDAATRSGLLAAFVPADNDETDALDFHRTIGGSAQAVRLFLVDTNAAVGSVTS